MTNHYSKFIKIIKSDLFKFFKDTYISFEIGKTDEYIFRLDLLNFYLYCFDENYKNLLKLLQINKHTHNSITYNIIKEQTTNTLFFVSNDIIIFHIKFNDFEDFYLSFIYSEFKMLVYKTESHYVIFCISHKSNEINNIKSFLLYNNNDIRYTILSFFINDDLNDKNIITKETTNDQIEYSKPIIYNDNFKYNSIIPLNINYKSLRINKTKKYDLTFHSIIGLGISQKQLVETVNVIIQYIKNNTYIPCNYINLY